MGINYYLQQESILNENQFDLYDLYESVNKNGDRMRDSLKIAMVMVVLVFITAFDNDKKNVAQTAANAKVNVPNPKLIEGLIRKWKIDRIYAYGVGGSRNGESDIKRLIGTEVVFSSDSIKFGIGAEVKPVFYKVSEFSDKHFISDINWIKETTLNTDLNTESLKEISLYEDHQYNDLYYGKGNITYYTYNDKSEPS